MKHFYSVLTAAALLLTNVLSAQSVTINTTNPNPTPTFTSPLIVNSTNGFSTTSTGQFNEFPNWKTTTLTSPEYFYMTPQTTVYFKYNFTIATAGGPTNVSAPVITITYGAVSIPLTAAPLSVANGTGDYYFTATLSSPIPAFTNFKIALTMTVPKNDRTVRANSLTTNAILAGSGGSLPLPVKLVNFKGSLNKNKVELQWLIAENETASKFEIQRSTNGTDFTTVATLLASGKPGDVNYSFSEITTSEKLVYRLKMYDNHSKAEYSKTLVFNGGSNSQKALQVLTNPVKEKLIISFTSTGSEGAQLAIYDNMGRMMQKQSLTTSQGVNTTTIALNGNYTSGLYIVELVSKAGKLSQKMLYSNQ